MANRTDNDNFSGDDLVEMDEEVLSPSLDELFETDTLKWVFVGGKGGVGKTTTACSTAIQFAKRREKVLILSTDPAHNLSDAFSQKFSNTPTLVKGFDNLYAMELDASFKESMQFTLEGAAGDDASGWQKMIPEFVSALPGIDEALGFAELMQSVQSLDYSVIVFDTAPTGHTLRLLTFPDIIDKGLRKLSTYRDKISGTLNIQNRFDAVKAITTSVKETFQDPTRTTFVCVCIPEFLSVYETERLVQELSRQNIDCSNIVVNQVVFPIGEGVGISSGEGRRRLKELEFDVGGQQNTQPPNGVTTTDDSATVTASNQLKDRQDKLQSLIGSLIAKLSHLEGGHIARRKMQKKYLDQIGDLYGDFHVVCMPLQEEEVRGVEKLRIFGNLLEEHRPFPSAPLAGHS